MTKLPAVACVLLVVASVLAPMAFAHAFLKHALPAAGAALNTAPSEVRLEFSEPLEPAFSRITVVNGAGQDVAQGKAQVAGAIMSIALRPLARGEYEVRWRALSVDTHDTQGAYRFMVR